MVNPNIATIQTSKGMADKTYFLPVNPYFVEKVIEKEKPDGILLSFGGQTALNCGIDLHRKGILQKHNLKVLGTPIKAIEDTEDRKLFVKELDSINVRTPKSIAVSSEKEALVAVKKIGFPVIIRVAYALGGRGSGIAKNLPEFCELVGKAFSFTSQILVEEYLSGWKEIEYEVVRDCEDNCITVCNMENFDPMGIHTGESIVVAPSQTLTNEEYHMLREIAIRTIRHLKIVGECNIQYALHPKTMDYRVIEVNARLSRSSALASKATGYPLAFIAAKLSLGYSLIELENQITKKTMACFEPALDYIVVKVPRWDLQKFRKVSTQIGTEMKSVGEVMAIGRSFEEVIQKAIRMLNIGMYGLVSNKISFKGLEKQLSEPTDKRIFAVVEALRKGYSVEKINKLTNIDKWFLYKIQNIVEIEKKLKKTRLEKLSKELLLKSKQAGFSDKQIAVILANKSELKVREKRKELDVLPFVKQIDTLAAEYPAKTNYLYITYHGIENDIGFDRKNSVIVLGSGAYSIGSSVEFDWCGVTAIKTLKKMGYKTIMVNFNPETVSTDYDMCDLLYFDELSLERVLDIYEMEKPLGIIISTGGQIPNNLAPKLHELKVKILGTSPESIDKAEDRHKFSKLCDELQIDQPDWEELTSQKESLDFAKKVGFPVIVRPSYVLSGAAMSVALDEIDLKNYLKKATSLSPEHPVIVSKFIANAREIEIDAVASKGTLIVWAITEHIENAGVHSGDATMVLPPQKTYLETIRRVKDIARKISSNLQISGPFNIQFIAKDNEVKVIECNLRSSRSFPFVSKVSGTDFIELAVKSIMGEKLSIVEKSATELDYVGVKAPQFSFSRLKGADPILSVEMSSTGEVACLGNDIEDAFLKSFIATGYNFPKKSIMISISGDENRFDLLKDIKLLLSSESGFELYATEHTHEFLKEHGVETKLIYKIHEKKQPNVSQMMLEKRLETAICIPNEFDKQNIEKGYILRRACIDYNVPLITNKQIAKLFIHAISKKKLSELEIKHWGEYVK